MSSTGCPSGLASCSAASALSSVGSRAELDALDDVGGVFAAQDGVVGLGDGAIELALEVLEAGEAG